MMICKDEKSSGMVILIAQFVMMLDDASTSTDTHFDALCLPDLTLGRTKEHCHAFVEDY